MLTVSDLLASSLLKSVKLVAGKSGMSNIVLGTGILDWEPVEIIPRYFNAGEVVLTTLTNVKNDNTLAEHYIKTLIINNASAIMIKTIHYLEISDSLKAFADEKKVPIFLFKDIYMDDIIYEVKRQLEINKSTSKHNEALSKLFNATETTADQAATLLDQINPYFFSKAFITIYISDDNTTFSDKMQSLYDYIYHTQNLLEYIKSSDFDIIYSRLIFKRGLFIVISFDTDNMNELKSYSDYLLNKLLSDSNFEDTRIGLGFCTSPSTIHDAIKQAVYTNICCIINKQRYAFYDNSLADCGILSVANNPEIREMLNKYEAELLHPTNKYTPLIDTAISLVHNHGNVEAVATELFQHKNTIRYRIKSISKIFGANNTFELYGRLYFFAILYQAKPFLDIFYK